MISLDGKTLCTIKNIIIQFKINGTIRSLVVTKYIELTFRNVFNTKKSSIGRKIVSNANENNFALINGKGINLGDFEK